MAHHGEIVGDEQVAQVKVTLQVAEQVQDLRLNRKVQGTDRLVADHQLRRRHQRPGDRDALTLATRELGRVPARGVGGKTNAREHRRRPLPRRCPGRGTVGTQRLGERLADSPRGVQRAVGVLEHDLQRRAQLPALAAGRAGDVPAGEANGPVRDRG
jgi:hypothetical protein